MPSRSPARTRTSAVLATVSSPRAILKGWTSGNSSGATETIKADMRGAFHPLRAVPHPDGRCHAIARPAVIVARPFAQRLSGVPLRTGDDPALLRRIVGFAGSRGQCGFACARFDGVIDLVTQPECRRLPAATRRAQCGMRIPSNRVGRRVEMIVVPMVDAQPVMPPARVFEAIEERALHGIAREIRFSRAVISLGAARHRQRTVTNVSDVRAPEHRAIHDAQPSRARTNRLACVMPTGTPLGMTAVSSMNR